MSIQALIRRATAIESLEKREFGDELKVMVVGVGGAGCNTVNRMKHLGLEVESVAINTDRAHLDTIEADKKVLLKVHRGFGTGGNPEVGERAALMASSALADIFYGADIVFLASGFGGGTGTGAAPVIADIARRQGALVISLITLPFKVERARFSKAKDGLRRIMKATNTAIVLENDKLLEIVPKLPLDKAFLVMDQIMSYTIMSFVDMLMKPSLINLDLSDIRTLMDRGGFSTILIGEGDARDPRGIVVDALNRPFIMDMDYSTASGGLIHITTGEDVTLSTVYSAVDAVSSFLKSTSNVIVGARVSPEFEGKMRILVVLTGIKAPFMAEVYREEKREDISIIR